MRAIAFLRERPSRRGGRLPFRRVWLLYPGGDRTYGQPRASKRPGRSRRRTHSGAVRGRHLQRRRRRSQRQHLVLLPTTESATVFLQQFGRGLRRAPGKAELVVFDLTGRQHLQFRFDRRLRSLLGHTPRELAEFVLRVRSASHWVPPSLRRAGPRRRAGADAPCDSVGPGGHWTLLREPAHAELSLAAFLHETEVALDDVYRKDRSWWGLRQAAALDARTVSQQEQAALENVHKLIHVGDERRLGLWARLTSLESPVDEADRQTRTDALRRPVRQGDRHGRRGGGVVVRSTRCCATRLQVSCRSCAS